MAKNANAGKKCIGAISPGNNSGLEISSGKLVLIGPIILAKESTLIKIFNQPLNSSFFKRSKTK